MKAVGIIGHKDSGKTTLAQALVDELSSWGHRVIVVKHSSHGIDLQGKDTVRLRESADQVAFISPTESMILWKGSRSLEEILLHLDADIFLLEGFKRERTFPKIVCLKGEPEDVALFDGLAILVGGALLLTPGILTDLVGFSFLFPPTRKLLLGRIRKRLEAQLKAGTIQLTHVNGFPGGVGANWGAWGPGQPPAEGEIVIEAEKEV